MRANPYVYVYPSEGQDAQRCFGVFALRLDACPVERSEDKEQRHQLQQSLVDLLNTLFVPEPPRTFALRYIVKPDPDSFAAGEVMVAFLGKVCTETTEDAQREASAFCEELIALLAGILPDYQWDMVKSEQEFQRLVSPFDLNNAYIAEIRRREEFVRLETISRRPSLRRGTVSMPEKSDDGSEVYFVYPFVPRPASLERLLSTLLLMRAPVIVQIAMSPVWLDESEHEALLQEVSKIEGAMQRPDAMASTIYRRRGETLREILLGLLLRLQDAPFLMNVVVASPEPLPKGLMEAVGVEITAPVGEVVDQPSYDSLARFQMGGYDVVYPSSCEEMDCARKNLQCFGFDPWGLSLAPEPLRRIRFLFDASEAVGAFKFPIAGPDGLPGLRVRLVRSRSLPREVAALAHTSSQDSVLLGTNLLFGFEEPVFISTRDRVQHAYVVGQTGTGKTTLLKTMILEDMSAGRGLAVIDPHGDLFDELLGFVPENRVDDVVVLDPMDVEFPVGLNLLECRDEKERHFIVREMRAIMERLIEDQYGLAASEYAGPAFYQHMQMNMLLVMSRQNDPGTLLEFYEVYQSNDYWRRWLPLEWQEPMLERWTETILPNIDYTKRHDQTMTWGEYLSSKFVDFVFDPRLRLMFGQKRSTINLEHIMNEGKILLVNLAKGELSEANSRFLGMVLMAKIQAAAMRRADLPPEERRMFYLYVDEFQSIATQNFILMLSEARKFGLGIVLANQFVSQIRNPSIVQSIFGNVGTIIVFRVGSDDAGMLEPLFQPFFSSTDLRNLPNWTACVKTSIGGQVVPPFTVQTILPDRKPDAQSSATVRSRSREQYGRPREQVQEEIEKSLRANPRLRELQIEDDADCFNDFEDWLDTKEDR